ncbi:hypothetical protein LguiA_007519 [Lonicera macranthoides]
MMMSFLGRNERERVEADNEYRLIWRSKPKPAASWALSRQILQRGNLLLLIDVSNLIYFFIFIIFFL